MTTTADPCVPCPCLCQHGTHDDGCVTPCSALLAHERREAELQPEQVEAGP
jgi:hypothetical protein